MNALLIFLDEPVPGNVMSQLSAEVGSEEATRRYKAIVSVLLEQLEGLVDTHVRFCHTPNDAGDALKFWLLPQLRGHTIKQGNTFLFTPEKHAPAFTIDFAAQGDGNSVSRMERASAQAFEDGYEKVALMGPDCLQCGSRWINASMLQVTNTTCVIGMCDDGSSYLAAMTKQSASLLESTLGSSEQLLGRLTHAAKSTALKLVHLPRLGRIHDEASWNAALNSAIGGKLRAAHKSEA